MRRFKFEYMVGRTVTVKAKTLDSAIEKAILELDRRYEAANKEPPVSWKLRLLEEICIKK